MTIGTALVDVSATCADRGDVTTDVAPPSDETLMDRYCAGDVDAFDELFRRYAGRVTRFVTPLVGPAHAADVAQVAFIKLHENRGRYRAGARFSSWIFAIARNTALDLLRRPSTRRERPDGDAGAETEAETSGPTRRDPLSDARVQAAVRALGDDMRDVVLLHWFADMPLDEVARAVGITHEAARARASRAYKALRQALGGEHGPA